MKSATGLTGAAVLTVGALSGCGVSTTHYEDRRYEVAGITAVKVRANSDLIEVVGTDAKTVRVHERLAYKSDRDKPTATHTTSNGTLDLRYRCDNLVIGFGACGVRYRVEVPRNTGVQVDQDSGPIRLTGLTGAVRAHSDSGSITAQRLRAGAVVLSADSGRIRVDGEARSMRLRTDSGAIHAGGLRVPVLHAHSDAGALRLAFLAPPETVQARTDSGSVTVRLPGDRGYRVVTASDSGGRHVTVPRDDASPHRITATTDSGAVTISPAA